MEHVWTVICLHALTNKETNNLSLIEVVERVTFQAEENTLSDLILVSVSINIVTLWWRGNLEIPENGNARIVIQSPNGDALPLSPFEYEIDLETYPRMRSTTTLDNIPFIRNGVYRFLIQLAAGNDWQTIAAVPLEIIQELPE